MRAPGDAPPRESTADRSHRGTSRLRDAWSPGPSQKGRYPGIASQRYRVIAVTARLRWAGVGPGNTRQGRRPPEGSPLRCSMATAAWSDIPAVRSVLARAYAEDPLMGWAFPDPTTRSESVAAWLGLFVEAAMGTQSVDILSRAAGAGDEQLGVEAVAVWRLPGGSTSLAHGLPTVSGLLTALIGPTRAGAVGRGLATLRPLNPEEPSACVQCLAVDPLAQRQGLGRAVLAPGSSRAEAAGLGVHLETANSAASSFYGALGFRVAGEVEVPEGGPRLWALRRSATARESGSTGR